MRAHQWIGLATSLVLAIVGGTGALIIWPGSSRAGRVAGRLHETLALGQLGVWMVIAASAAAVILELSGLVLWWRTRTMAVRPRQGWWPAVVDLHHAVGIVGLTVMLVLAGTALGLACVTPTGHPTARRILMDVHTAQSFPSAVKVLLEEPVPAGRRTPILRPSASPLTLEA